VEGRDFIIEWAVRRGRAERYDAIADELAKLKVDIFVVRWPGRCALQRAAPEGRSCGHFDRSGRTGFAQSLSRPGGMITGLANSVDDTAPKQLELSRRPFRI